MMKTRIPQCILKGHSYTLVKLHFKKGSKESKIDIKDTFLNIKQTLWFQTV